MRIAFLLLGTCLLTAGLARHVDADDWVDSRVVGPFVCRAEFPLQSIEGLLGELGQLQADLVRLLGVPPAREPISLVLFRDKASYSNYLKRNLPGVPFRRALYVKSKGRGTVLAYRQSELAVDLRHEGTHALLHAALPRVPLWLDEGLAEYFEMPPKQRAFDNPHLASFRWGLFSGKPLDMRRLERVADVSGMGKTEYRSSWAWVHFMLHGSRDAHAELVGFLRDIRANAPPRPLSGRIEQRISNPSHPITQLALPPTRRLWHATDRYRS